LTKKVEKEEEIPFSISMREPNINHLNEKNPLDIYDENSINKFRCFFNTREITSYRRYLKIINYTTYGGFNYKDSIINELYLDDYEDSRKIKKDNIEDENFLGSYRILLSKKIDIYERKFDSLFTLISKLLSFYSLIMLIFVILIKIFVKPNDSIRIYEALEKRNKSFTKPETIFISFNEAKTIDLDKFKEQLKRSKCQKFCDKFAFIFCYCCNKNPRTEYLYIIKDYIDKNLSPENQMINSVKDDKKKGEGQNRSIELPENNNNIINNYDSDYLIEKEYTY
jgi:hypothetical protein